MNGINKIFKVIEHFVLIQAALGACIEQESQLIKKIVKRKEFFLCSALGAATRRTEFGPIFVVVSA